jgi:hypothetical protein
MIIKPFDLRCEVREILEGKEPCDAGATAKFTPVQEALRVG